MIAAAYLLMAPPSADLAAALYRSELLARHGFTLWDGQWYAGHHTPAYSVLFPPLAWLVGVRVLAALSVIAAAGLFAVLLDRHVDSPSALGPVWFGGGVAVDLLTGRVAFLLGVALGLAALLRAGRARSWSAGALALLSALASPVAGAFVVLAGAVGVMTGPRRAVAGALVAGALTPIALSASGRRRLHARRGRRRADPGQRALHPLLGRGRRARLRAGSPRRLHHRAPRRAGRVARGHPLRAWARSRSRTPLPLSPSVRTRGR